MTKLIYILLLLSLCFKGYAQEWSDYSEVEKFKVIDTAKYEITYDIVAKLGDYPKAKCRLGAKCRRCNNRKIRDQQKLLIGSKCSATYSKPLLDLKIKNLELIKKGARAVKTPELTFPEDVFKHYPNKGKMTALYRLFTSSGSLAYEDEINLFAWKLDNEYQAILGYKCQKATCSFRGRDYTAWFTEEIPLSEGPWKFCGLPGLILKVSDNEDNFIFTCVGVEVLKAGKPIHFWTNKKIKETSRRKKLVTVARMYKRPVAFKEAMGIKYHTRGRRDFSYPYNPIELE